MLTVESLRKSFRIHIREGMEIVGFDEVSFDVAAGTCVGLRGASGAGKSSVLKCVYRTYLPSRGRIWFDSTEHGRVDLASLDEHTVLRLRQREIGHVTQFLKALPRVPALDVVAEPLRALGVGVEEARRRSAAMLERLHVPSKLFGSFPVTFSGGEQQRVNFARAVIRRPRLLLLDEPTASLDAEAMEIVIDILRELRDAGTSMIVIFHDKALMEAIADTTYVMPDKHHG
jgi:alpha-D-ribose 1-methylphosphonate 5-triphosphate synthase subunit PhnL